MIDSEALGCFMSYSSPEPAPTPLVKMVSDPWRYTAYEGDGRVFLSVLCGTHALYLVNIELNAEELAVEMPPSRPSRVPSRSSTKRSQDDIARGR